MTANTPKLSELDWEHVLIGFHTREKSGFVSELVTRVSHRLLPPYVARDDARIFVSSVGPRFREEIEAHYESDENLAERIAADGRTAFDQLAAIATGELENRPIFDRIRQLELDPVFLPRSADANDFEEHVASLESMLRLLSGVRESYGKLGTSIELSYRTEKLISDVVLLQKILHLFVQNDPSQQREALCRIVEESVRDRSITRFVERKLLNVLVEVVAHNADTGEKYIAGSKDELKGYFVAACIGGVFVSLFAFLKIGIGSIGLPPLSEAFAYGLNYAACFAFATLAGGTIATKQPAMTAHAFSRSLSSGNPNRESAWALFQKVLVSQTVSLIGNVLSVSVITFLIWMIVVNPNNFDVDPSYHVSKNTFGFAVLWYATVAGLWLSVSGLLSGYVSNLLVYHRVAERANIRGFNVSKMQKVAPKLFGSVVLGFLLGGTGSIGVLTGIPVDIRHVAFSSAQVTLGLIESQQIVPWAIVGVATIGIVNLVVSFAATWWVSRLQLRANQTRIAI